MHCHGLVREGLRLGVKVMDVRDRIPIMADSPSIEGFETLRMDRERSRAMLMDLGMPDEDVSMNIDIAGSHQGLPRGEVSEGSPDVVAMAEEVCRTSSHHWIAWSRCSGTSSMSTG